MRVIYFFSFSILTISGCTYISSDKAPLLSSPKLKNLNESERDYYISGKIFFKHPEGSHTGEMTIHISRKSELKLSIFAPLIGSLIYEMRASSKKFLILDFQGGNYYLDENTKEVRKSLLGMDISLTELKWLIFGNLPKKSSSWIQKKISKNEYKLTQGSTKIKIRLNTFGKIESMEKFSHGFLEYRAGISLYQKDKNSNFPKKISIKNYSEISHWLMLITERQIKSGEFNPIDFKPPKGMKPHKNDQ